MEEKRPGEYYRYMKMKEAHSFSTPGPLYD